MSNSGLKPSLPGDELEKAANLAAFAVGLYPGDPACADGTRALVHVALAGRRVADAARLHAERGPGVSIFPRRL